MDKLIGAVIGLISGLTMGAIIGFSVFGFSVFGFSVFGAAMGALGIMFIQGASHLNSESE